MCVAYFLSGLPSSFDYVRAQLLGFKKLPSLSEVFSCLHQASLSNPPSISTTRDVFALVSFVGGFCSSSHGPNRGPNSFGRGGGSSGRVLGSGSRGGSRRAPGYNVSGYSDGGGCGPCKCTYYH